MRRTRFRLLTLLAVLCAFALVAAACGDDNETAVDPTPTATEPAAESSSEPAADPEDESPAEPAVEEMPAEDYTIATVVKLVGVAWFDRMEEGTIKFGEDNEGVTTLLQGPADADVALQAQVIEDLIAQGVDALTVVPNSAEGLETVLGRAQDEGIIVVTHEASNQQNTSYDIEAFRNDAYGRHFMDALAERMGEEGEYAVMVGSLTSTSHNEWVDAAIAHQEATYPNMTLVGDKIETNDDTATAFERTQELLVAFPNLAGIQGSSAVDVIGAGQAIEEAGLEDQIAVVGTSIPSITSDLIKTGAIDMISFWDPSDAGYAMDAIALMLLRGQEPTSGMDLGLPGYESIEIDGKVIYGAAWVDVTLDNLEEWSFI